MKPRLMFLCALLAMGAAQSGHGYSDLSARVSRLERDMQKVRGETAFGNFGAKTAAAFPQIDGYGVFFTGDFLLWKLYEFETDYAFKTQPSSTAFKGEVHSMNFHWNPGFRLGAGYVFDYDGWDIYLNYTNYMTRANQELHGHSGKPLVLLWGVGTEVDEAHARWRFLFNSLDFTVGRNFFVSESFSLHPFFGISTSWIEQRRRLSGASATTSIRLRGKNNFWGMGPKLGLDAQYFFGRKFSLYASGSAALLYGDFDVYEKEVSRSAGVIYYKEPLNTDRMAPTAGLALGAAYETNFNENRNHFTIKVGYENLYFWKQNQFPIVNGTSFSQERLSDDLGMQGLTVDFCLDF